MAIKIGSKKFILDITAKILLTVVILGALPQTVLALALDSVPIDHPGLGQGGVAGDAAAVAANSALGVAEIHINTCDNQELVNQGFDSGINAALPGLSLITGGADEAAYLQNKITTLDTQLACREIDKVALEKIPSVNLLVQQKKQQLLDKTVASIKTLQARKDQLMAQQRVAKAGFWKGVFVKLMVNLSKSMATRLVNMIINNYKVNDFARYASVLGAQVYTTDYIMQNADVSRDQLMIRSMLTNPLLREKIPNAAFQRASDSMAVNNIPFKAEEINYDDPKFFLKLNKTFAADAQPAMVSAVLSGKANSIEQSANTAAKTEINASNGIKSPHTCSDVVSQQNSIDREWKAVNDKVADRQALVDSLENELNLLKNFTASNKQKISQDLAKARTDLKQAHAELSALDGKYDNKAVVKFCDSVSTPGNLVNQGVDKLVNSVISKASDFSDNNLSSVQSTLTNLATTVFENLLFGRTARSSIVNELTNSASAVTGIVVSGLSEASVKRKLDQKQANMEKGVDFDWDFGSSASEYILTWSVDQAKIKNASYATIAGTGVSPTQRLNLSGSLTVNSSLPGNYFLRVFAANNTTALVTVSVTTESSSVGGSSNTTPNGTGNAACGGNYSSLQVCVQQTGDQNYCASICSQVQGAFTQATVNIRGPSGITPRGPAN